MATVKWLGHAKPDDPIYQGGAVVGGKRFYNTSKSGKAAKPKGKKESVPGERTEREEAWFDLQAEQRLADRMKVQIATQSDGEAFQAGEAAYFADLTRRWPDISKEEADELQWFKEQK